MLVRMLQTIRGSQDGTTVETHTQGFKYDLCESLAYVYLSNGYAEEAAADEPVEEVAEVVGPEEAPEAGPATDKEHKRRGRTRKG